MIGYVWQPKSRLSTHLKMTSAAQDKINITRTEYWLNKSTNIFLLNLFNIDGADFSYCKIFISTILCSCHTVPLDLD